ncbi:MAG: PQQ-binding-like beta-propeller repeat protein [Holophagales bacterium]|nr:PQQ-binding-like beta-propeller repeat protein [Holophagales bacterium]
MLAAIRMPAGAQPAAGEWPQFRGDGTGTAPDSGYVLTWSETEHITWKLSLPGRGHSSPVVKDGKIWLTTAMEEEHSLRLLGFDLESGESLHDVELFRPEKWLPSHPDNSYASPTPAADGERVCAHFGSYGTACVSTGNGEILWRGQPFVQRHEVGPGGSPVLFRDLLIVACDGTDSQLVAAVRATTGELVWRTPRHMPESRKPPQRKAFSTPLVVRQGPRWMVLSTGAAHTSAYDPTTGDELWWVEHEGYSNVAMPVVGLGFAFVNTGYNRPHLLAVALGGKGNVTESHVRWQYYWQVPANPTPLLVGQRLFFVSDRGNATWLDASRGEDLWRQRLGGKHYASPLVAGGRIYTFAVDGTTKVIEASDTFRQLAHNRLEGSIYATPALAGGALLVRTDRHLYRIEQRTTGAAPNADPDRAPDTADSFVIGDRTSTDTRTRQDPVQGMGLQPGR